MRFVIAILLTMPLLVSCAGCGATTCGTTADDRRRGRPERWAEPIENRPGLPNLFKVSDRLYRGAQPEDAGFAQLAAMGIRTVVNLRTFHSDRDACREHGLEYVKITAQAWEAETEEIVEFLKIAVDPGRRPVFVHCRHGADRTGLMVAAYRVVMESWSKEEAIEEMTRGGFGYHTIWANLVSCLKSMDTEALRQAVLARKK